MTELTIRIMEGRYYITHPNDVQASCRIVLKVGDVKAQITHVLLPIEKGEHLLGHDGDDPEELLHEIVKAGEGLWLYSPEYDTAKAMLKRIRDNGQLARDICRSWLTGRETGLRKRRTSIEEELAKIARSLAWLTEEDQEHA
jgi:hypothetical protein